MKNPSKYIFKKIKDFQKYIHIYKLIGKKDLLAEKMTRNHEHECKRTTQIQNS